MVISLMALNAIKRNLESFQLLKKCKIGSSFESEIV